MAGRRKQVAPVVIPSTALVASAVRYSGKAARIYQPNQDWQKDSYRHYSICGEARYAANYYGHALSRVTLYAADRVPGGTYERQDPTTPASVTLDELFAGKDGQAQMLSQAGVHLTVAGEFYIVGRKAAPDRDTERGVVEANGEVWEVVSVLEVKVNGSKWSIEYADGKPPLELADDDTVIRVWVPHPERRIQADSPFRSLLPVLTEIEWLTRHIFAQCSSRLAGAGLLFVSQGLTFPQPMDESGKAIETATEADALMITLAEGMMTPISDPSSPSALVPTVVTVPAESIGKSAELLHFWSDLDEKALEMRSAAVHRFAVGMDLPPETLEGMSSNPGTGGGNSNGVSHWGAWQIEESTIKLHIEPMLEVLVNSITVGYLRPLTEDDSVVRYDTANLRLRPDRSKESMELWDRGALATVVMLRENGFGEDDMPDDAEQKQWFLRKVASGSATPEQVGAALAMLGVPLPVQEAPEDVRETPPAPSLEDHPTQDIPEAATLLAACEPLVYRALERVGNRLRSAGARPDGIPAYETHLFVKAENLDYVLNDAWSCAALTLDGVADVPVVVDTLDRYARTLVSTQTPHSRNLLSKWLEGATVP